METARRRALPEGSRFALPGSADIPVQCHKDLNRLIPEGWPIQVKQKDKAGRPDIDSFEAMKMR